MELKDKLAQLTPEQRRKLSQKLGSAKPGRSKDPDLDEAETLPFAKKSINFSLFFFSANGSSGEKDPYGLLMDVARFGDANRFKAIWTPERHFQDFGGIYPNPSVLTAALAMVTKNLQLRAGSLVLPLHHPVRVAEDWAVIDNLSGGRAAISFATGWHPHDYVFRPEAYEDRREIMFRGIEQIRQLWAGEALTLPGPQGEQTAVKTRPRPVQKELPVWVTATSKATWERAGAMGANILSALIATEIEALASLIKTYRKARARNGHDPRKGVVSLMMHTYLGNSHEQVKALVRDPMKRYLRQYIGQFKAMGAMEGGNYDEEAILEYAFERYMRDRSLLGTPAEAAGIVNKLAAIGVNDIACLLDFGLSRETVMAAMPALANLRKNFV